MTRFEGLAKTTHSNSLWLFMMGISYIRYEDFLRLDFVLRHVPLVFNHYWKKAYNSTRLILQEYQILELYLSNICTCAKRLDGWSHPWPPGAGRWGCCKNCWMEGGGRRRERSLIDCPWAHLTHLWWPLDDQVWRAGKNYTQQESWLEYPILDTRISFVWTLSSFTLHLCFTITEKGI